jgi:hypothetical protein
MSLYTNNQVSTMYLEPSLHNSSRSTEFRIKHQGKILPNLRLIEVGLVQSGAVNAHYNKLGGVKSMIKNIHLYDGKTSLSSLLEAPQYQAFKVYNQDVQKNKSLEQQLNQSNNAVIGAKEETAGDILELFQDNRTQSQNTSSATGKGWIDLRDYFPILKALNHLDTENVFKNLRVVIEYEFDSDLVVDRDDRPGTANSPRLVYDAVEDPDAMAPNPEAVSWNEIETDSFQASAGGAGAQTVNARINGFTNKSLGKLVMCKRVDDLTQYVDTNAVKGVGALGSVAQQSETVQLTISGIQRFPRDGLNCSKNRGIAMLADLWGECSAFPFASLPNVQNLATETSADVENMAGQLSYCSYDHSGERVGDFEVEYKRTINTGAGAPDYCGNLAMTVRLYGEVAKTIMFKGNDYNIVYN